MSFCLPISHCYSPNGLQELSGRSTSRSADMSGYHSDGPSSRLSTTASRTHCKPNIMLFERDKCSSARGIRALLGRLIHANSGSLQGESNENNPFQRGCHTRSTTTACRSHPQNDWNRSTKLSPVEAAFAAWTRDQVCAWLAGIGLESYVPECHRWLKNGLQLINASTSTLERELNMRNPLHQKKLRLCLQSLCGTVNENEYIRQLDILWVQRWLDDIGLQQYKDRFQEAKIDGRMLHHLTVDDLIQLNVTNELHHLSIKRAIQILRIYGFHPQCLKRRPAENDKEHVMLWTNHRVMEWLRAVDLSEYASNLRGSGVHGALIVLEPRFNPDCLADILAIPHIKTLLRRHLTSHFISLVGQEVYRKKMELLKSHYYTPLDIHSKVKTTKKQRFSYRKMTKKTPEFQLNGLICPVGDLATVTSSENQSHSNRSSCRYNKSPLHFMNRDKQCIPNYDQIAMSTMRVVKKHSPTTFV